MEEIKKEIKIKTETRSDDRIVFIAPPESPTADDQPEDENNVAENFFTGPVAEITPIPAGDVVDFTADVDVCYL